MSVTRTKASGLPCQLAIQHVVTADMDDGQPLPPFFEDGRPWHLVRRAGGRSLWRRLFLGECASSTAAPPSKQPRHRGRHPNSPPKLAAKVKPPVTDWRKAPGDQTRAP
jgi:hypothetical protein